MLSKNSYSSSLGGIVIYTRARLYLFVSLSIVWMIAGLMPTYKTTITQKFNSTAHQAISHLPTVQIDYHPSKHQPFNASKLAILIEGRPLPHLVPQLLHMMAVVPPDWRFMFIGSNLSVMSVNRSFATRSQQMTGKLDLRVLPEPWELSTKEHVWRLMTDLRFYNALMPNVEWLLKFESDSIMCANSATSLNEWLEFDWAGAPRFEDDQFAGNGGLTFRRMSAVRKILAFQSRYNDTRPEDEWFGRRIMVLPGAVVASSAMEDRFSVEDTWHEKPMGYHIKDGGMDLPDAVWKAREQRKRIFDYCPELSMIMPMKLERERCEGDNGEGDIIIEES